MTPFHIIRNHQITQAVVFLKRFYCLHDGIHEVRFIFSMANNLLDIHEKVEKKDLLKKMNEKYCVQRSTQKHIRISLLCLKLFLSFIYVFFIFLYS